MKHKFKRGLSMALSILMVCSCFIGVAGAAQSETGYSIEYITPAVYDELGSLSEGLIYARKGNQPMYLDENGNVVITSEQLADGASWDSLGAWNDSARRYSSDGQPCYQFSVARGGVIRRFNAKDYEYTYFDLKGKELFRSNREYEFYDGLAIAYYYEAADGTYYDYAIVNKNGEVVKAFNPSDLRAANEVSSEVFYDIERLSINEGKILYYRSAVVESGEDYAQYDSKVGYLDTNCKVVIPAKFDEARPFNNGIAAVRLGEKWGFIDTTGNFVIEPMYGNFFVRGLDYQYEVFSEGYACVEKDGKWGFINRKGETVIPFQFEYDDNDNLGMIQNGYVSIVQNGDYTYYGIDGTVLDASKYSDKNYASENGIALVAENGVYKLIDMSGNTVSPTWNFESSIVGYGYGSKFAYQMNGKWGLGKIVKSGPSDWAAEEIAAARSAGIVPALTGNPSYQQQITREQFAELLMALVEKVQGTVTLDGSTSFTDCSNPQVLKAAQLGIIQGTGNGTFAPNALTNREQIATMVNRAITYLNEQGKSSIAPKGAAGLGGFSDHTSVSSWASEGVGVLAALGVIKGTSATTISPQDPCTVEQSILFTFRTFKLI